MLYSFEDYTLDPDRRELRHGTHLVAVEPQVFDLLQFLIRHRDRVVTRDDVLNAVWNGRAVSESALAVRINAARLAISDNGQQQRLIRTLPRKGLRFIGDVREHGVSPAREAESAVKAAATRPDVPSIAVLPFTSMSEDADQEYFADGISEDILTALSRVRSFLVIARNSSFTYKGRAVPLGQIANELAVRYIVEGSVRKSGDRVRITAQLNDAGSGSHLWAEQYDRQLVDVFAVQDDVTNSIVAAIEPQIYAAENFRAKRKPPASMDAWDLVMRALAHYWRVTRDDHAAAQGLLERALAIDPNYGQALSLLAASHMFGVHLGWADLASAASIAEHAALTAVRCDQEDAWAHTALGSVYFSTGRLDDALSELELALALNPNFLLAQGYHALALSYAGCPEDSFAAAQKAARLSPRDPSLAIYHGIAAYARFTQCKYDEAIALAREAISHRGDLTGAYRVLAVSAGMTGDKGLADTALEQLRRIQPNLSLAWIATQLPWNKQEDRDHYVEGFRRAGLT